MQRVFCFVWPTWEAWKKLKAASTPTTELLKDGIIDGLGPHLARGWFHNFLPQGIWKATCQLLFQFYLVLWPMIGLFFTKLELRNIIFAQWICQDHATHQWPVGGKVRLLVTCPADRDSISFHGTIFIWPCTQSLLCQSIQSWSELLKDPEGQEPPMICHWRHGASIRS